MYRGDRLQKRLYRQNSAFENRRAPYKKWVWTVFIGRSKREILSSGQPLKVKVSIKKVEYLLLELLVRQGVVWQISYLKIEITLLQPQTIYWQERGRIYLKIPPINYRFIVCVVNDKKQISTFMTYFQFDFSFHYAAVVGVKRTIDSLILVFNYIKGIDSSLMLSVSTWVKRI